jgi:hypothetical protein
MMKAKLLAGLVPLLAVAAIAAMPVVAQAEGTHFYRNGTKITEGLRVPTITWGPLTNSNGGGAWACTNFAGGYVENPVGGGAGVEVIQNWASAECSTAECPLDTRFEGILNPEKNGNKGWFGHVTEEEGVSRLETTGIDLVLSCWTQAPWGPGNVSTGERGTPVAPVLPFKGTWTPKLKNGTTGGKPSKVEFGRGSGELINESIGGFKITGSLTTLGYVEQELVTTGT